MKREVRVYPRSVYEKFENRSIEQGKRGYYEIRVVHHDLEPEPYYGIREVYFNIDGTAIAYSENLVSPMGDTLNEFLAEFRFFTGCKAYKPIKQSTIQEEVEKHEGIIRDSSGKPIVRNT